MFVILYGCLEGHIGEDWVCNKHREDWIRTLDKQTCTAILYPLYGGTRTCGRPIEQEWVLIPRKDWQKGLSKELGH